MKEKTNTSLDILYDLLQEKKIMKIEDIARHFNVTPEIAIRWGEILEAGELAKLINPRMGKSVIKLAGYIEEELEKEQKIELHESEKKIKDIFEKKEDLEEMNKLIKNRNQEKINEARKIISESRKRGHAEEFIKKMFVDKGWPIHLIDDLLK